MASYPRRWYFSRIFLLLCICTPSLEWLMNTKIMNLNDPGRSSGKMQFMPLRSRRTV
jgi:hypothetical protein